MHSTIIDVTQVLLAIISLIGAIATPVLTALAIRWFHLSAESTARNVVATAIQNGVALVEAKADDAAKQNGKLAVTDTNVAKVAAYVLPKVQQSLKTLAVDAPHLGDVIAANLAKRQTSP